uniref:Uncharacterized protein n=1 Tax=Strigamia maritima TaxID=126957 RepID=T1JA17_STRMM
MSAQDEVALTSESPHILCGPTLTQLTMCFKNEGGCNILKALSLEKQSLQTDIERKALNLYDFLHM